VYRLNISNKNIWFSDTRGKEEKWMHPFLQKLERLRRKVEKDLPRRAGKFMNQSNLTLS